MNDHQNTLSYVLINPPPDTRLELNDIVYVWNQQRVFLQSDYAYLRQAKMTSYRIKANGPANGTTDQKVYISLFWSILVLKTGKEFAWSLC